jgi:transposase-like protein
MNIFDFIRKFPNEQSCEDYLREKRVEEGIVCSRCHLDKHYWLATTKQFKCANCGKKINLTAGTLMESSHIPLQTWFRLIHLMTTTKKPFSALEMQKQMGSKYYEPIWYAMQKIRITMGKRDVVDLTEEKGLVPLKRGRGAQHSAKVLVMVESKPNPKQTLKYKKERIMGFAKMIVVDDLTKLGVNYEVSQHISPTSIVISDAYRSYSDLHQLVQEHNAMVVPAKEASEKLPWVHTVIANAKRSLLGVHHSIGRDFLQNYLNEFVYKLNRRTFTSDLFDRLIVAGANDTWY